MLYLFIEAQMIENAWKRKESKFPAILIIAGLLYLLSLQLLVRENTFFSGDGGLKYLQIRQFASGNFSLDLQLPASVSVRRLWNRGFYPFEPPFIYHINEKQFMQFNPLFAAISAPFYWAIGFRGLFVLPVLSTTLLWFGFYRATKLFQVHSKAVCFGLVSLIFGTYLTVYSAMLWEHTLAVCMAFAGFMPILPHSGKTRDGALGTLLSASLFGISGWLRPECFILMVAAFVILPQSNLQKRHKWLFFAASATVLFSFTTFNIFAYGHALGLHSLQVVNDPLEASHRVSGLYLLPIMAALFLAFCPMSLIPILRPLFAGKGTIMGDHKAERAMWIAIVVFCSLSIFVLPCPGGKQFGPRFWMPVIPLFCLILTFQIHRCVAVSHPGSRYFLWVSVAILAVGIAVNSVWGPIVVCRDYRYRVLPALQYVQKASENVVIVDHQWIAQEFAAVLHSKTFYRIRNDRELMLLYKELKKEGIGNALFITSSKEFAKGRNATIRCQSKIRIGSYCLVHVLI